MFPPTPFGDIAADFAGSTFGDVGTAGPSASGDITGGGVDFGPVNIGGTQGLDFNNPLVIGGAILLAGFAIWSAFR